MTNFEKIKEDIAEMTAEEFSRCKHRLVNGYCEYTSDRILKCPKQEWKDGLSPCEQCMLKWLESEVKE